MYTAYVCSRNDYRTIYIHNTIRNALRIKFLSLFFDVLRAYSNSKTEWLTIAADVSAAYSKV